jgi:hypothetical protein
MYVTEKDNQPTTGKPHDQFSSSEQRIHVQTDPNLYELDRIALGV